MFIVKNIKTLILPVILSAMFLALPAIASETNGTIDATYKYAWGENLGWINFSPDNGGLNITDTAVTGYAWSGQYGWINFSPTNSGQGVTNNCSGQLGGSAWSAHKGWIDMSGVTINTSGKFTGIAGSASAAAGRINFDCDNCDVRTDWRQCSLRAVAGGGGSGGIVESRFTAISASGVEIPLTFTINNGENEISNPALQIRFNANPNVVRGYLISIYSDFRDAAILSYSPLVKFELPHAAGEYTVYVRYYTILGNYSDILSRTVTLLPGFKIVAQPVVPILPVVEQKPVVVEPPLGLGEDMVKKPVYPIIISTTTTETPTTTIGITPESPTRQLLQNLRRVLLTIWELLRNFFIRRNM